jgi:hypothetical protein
LGIDQSGQDIFFFTGNQLTPQDQDTQEDWYDAREGGGFPAPSTAIECSGEACREPFSSPPSLPIPGGTQVVVGGDNLAPLVAVARPATPKPKPLSRKQKLAKALKACRQKPRKQRAGCERQVRRKFQMPGTARARKANMKAKGRRG